MVNLDRIWLREKPSVGADLGVLSVRGLEPVVQRPGLRLRALLRARARLPRVLVRLPRARRLAALLAAHAREVAKDPERADIPEE